jgi:hypothetical protein
MGVARVRVACVPARRHQFTDGSGGIRATSA